MMYRYRILKLQSEQLFTRCFFSLVYLNCPKEILDLVFLDILNTDKIVFVQVCLTDISIHCRYWILGCIDTAKPINDSSTGPQQAKRYVISVVPEEITLIIMHIHVCIFSDNDCNKHHSIF